jgi:hypothetical protein
MSYAMELHQAHVARMQRLDARTPMPSRKPVVRRIYLPSSPERIAMDQAAREQAIDDAIGSWPKYQIPAPYDACEGSAPPPVRVKTGHQIIREVAAQHGFSAAELIGPRRQVQLVAARFEAMWRIKTERPDMSLPMIGRLFHRDHTTILHGTRVHERRRQQ